jgi:hypothetical protein
MFPCHTGVTPHHIELLLVEPPHHTSCLWHKALNFFHFVSLDRFMLMMKKPYRKLKNFVEMLAYLIQSTNS